MRTKHYSSTRYSTRRLYIIFSYKLLLLNSSEPSAFATFVMASLHYHVIYCKVIAGIFSKSLGVTIVDKPRIVDKQQ